MKVAWSLAVRSIANVFRVPGAFIPILIQPLFFLLAFSGSFSGVTQVKGFPTDVILNWVMPYSVLQGAAFAGMGATFSVARDLEGGFYDRLLLSPSSRRALLLGPVLAAMVRSLIPATIVFSVAVVGGARLADGPIGLVTLLIAALGVAAVGALWGMGVIFRLKSQRAMGLVQIGIFVSMFLSASQMPVGLIDGWLHPIARLTPVTNVLRLAREGFLPGGVTWSGTWGGLLALAGLGAVMTAFAWSGLRKLIP